MGSAGVILVVDDEASIRRIAQAYLEQAGFRVVCVENGLYALRQAEADSPDLILLDLNLPGMDGMEVAARLRERSDVFNLMLTARERRARHGGQQLQFDGGQPG
ncbi:MAG: response regulator, partial [Chloroflexales bacterium]|nr:response regulator [Chloroflexales bacterium]